MFIVLAFLLVAFFFKSADVLGRRTLVLSFAVIVPASLICTLSFNILMNGGTLAYWNDSREYYNHSYFFLTTIKNNQSNIVESLKNFAHSRNFAFSSLCGLNMVFGFNIVTDIIIANAVISALAITVGVVTICNIRLYRNSQLAILFFIIFGAISTYFLFWNAFLLKDTIIAGIVSVAIYSYVRKHYYITSLLVVTLTPFRFYLAGILGLSLLFAHYFNPFKMPLKSICVIILSYVVLLFSYERFETQVLWLIMRSADWSMSSASRTTFNAITSLLLEPIFPNEDLKIPTAYAYITWKVNLIMALFASIISKKAIKIWACPSFRPWFYFIIFSTFLYSHFPRFSNFRHRLFFEPAIFAFGTLALENLVRRGNVFYRANLLYASGKKSFEEH